MRALQKAAVSSLSQHNAGHRQGQAMIALLLPTDGQHRSGIAARPYEIQSNDQGI